MKITVHEKKLNESENNDYNVYVGHYELIITDKVLGEPYGFIDTTPLYDNLEDDLLADYPSATIVYDQDIKDEVIANVYPWLEGDENTGSVQFADFSNDVAESKNESENPISNLYGDGGIYTGETGSADGFYPNKDWTLPWAILNNDVASLEKLHDGNLTSDKPVNTSGWLDDYKDMDDESTHYWYYDWEWDYDQHFVKDFCRVIGKTDNQYALRKMLEYEPDFIVCPVDFSNAIHAGYDKDLILALLNNIRSVVDDEDLKVNYLGDDDYVDDEHPDPIQNLVDFLEN